MKLELTAKQKDAQSEFRAFVNEEIIPYASQCDREEHTPPQLIKKLALRGFLGAAIPEKNGGSGMDAIAYGLLNEEIGRGCSSLRSLLTVHSMVAHVLCKWGSQYQKEHWIPKLASGEPGLSIKPIVGILGTRASMLAELHLDDCQIPQENLVCRQGFGFSHVASSALDRGRYSVAWGCVGIGQACLEACLQYTSQRQQFGVYLKEHQIIRQMISEAIANVKAARLLCYQAGYLQEIGDPRSISETSIAKYFASTMAVKVASDAVQIHGGNGCSSDYPVERYFRDAKIMEIIEGSTQIQQITIAESGYQEYGVLPERNVTQPNLVVRT
jgi:alkylation response protein AidB-like acyl-CoA dehydrogenase